MTYISRIAAAFAMTAAFLLAPTPSFAGKADDTLNVVFPRPIKTIDNLYSTRRENIIASLLVDDALFYVSDSGEVVPLLAKSYKLASETELDIELHKGILFHDGSELTAEDVVYSYEFIVNKKAKSRYRSRISKWMKGVEQLGPYRVRFTMKFPYPNVLYDLAYWSKVRKKGTYDAPGTDTGLDPKAQHTELNGLGPYRVVEFIPGQKLVIERFDKYRSNSPKGEPAIRKIVMRNVPEVGTQTAELISGGADWAYEISREVAENVAASGRANFVAGPEMRIGYILLDAAGLAEADGPVTKRKVRQAMIHSIDRQSLVSNLVGGKAEVIDTFCNPVQFGCDAQVESYAYDPARARALLKEAGYEDGFDLTLWAARERPIVEAIVNQWRKAGIRTTLKYVKSSAQGKARNQKKTVARYHSWGSYGIPDAGAIVPIFFEYKSKRNFAKDKKLDELLGKAMSTHDREKRKAFFGEALNIIADEAYVIPLYRYTQNYVISNDLHFVPSKDGMTRFFEARWK